MPRPPALQDHGTGSRGRLSARRTLLSRAPSLGASLGLAIASLGVLHSAVAAEVTDIPPKWRGDIHLRYDGTFQQVGLEEDGLTFGLRNSIRHDVGLRGEVAVYDGVVITLGLPITASSRMFFPAARQMLYETLSGGGTYVGGPEITGPDRNFSGIEGVWLGAAFTPFNEAWRRSPPITARFDIAARTPSATMYSAARGVAPGGPALRLAGAFSSHLGATNPYLALDTVIELPGTTDVVSDSGATVASDLSVRGGHRVDARLGVELIATESRDAHSRVAIDLFMGFGYRGAATTASGFWLPSVLPATESVPVIRSEFLIVRGGGAVDVHINRWIGLRIGGEARAFTPHRIEHPYAVRTDGQSFEAAWTLGVVGRIRGKADTGVPLPLKRPVLPAPHAEVDGDSDGA